jgi:hypothetical protein
MVRAPFCDRSVVLTVRRAHGGEGRSLGLPEVKTVRYAGGGGSGGEDLERFELVVVIYGRVGGTVIRLLLGDMRRFGGGILGWFLHAREYPPRGVSQTIG